MVQCLCASLILLISVFSSGRGVYSLDSCLFCSDRGAVFFAFWLLLRLAVLIALFCRGRRLRRCEVGDGELKFPQSRVLARALYEVAGLAYVMN